jgi:2'-5' RNA ligase
LWPDAGVRDAIAAWSDQWQWNSTARRVRPGQLHLTLHFLGEVARARLPPLREALALPFAPFTLRLARPALWRGGIAVLEPERVPRRLHQVHFALAEALRRIALPVEDRPWRPHVTLARQAVSAVPPEHGPTLRWQVRGYALVESHPQPEGGYAVLEVFSGAARHREVNDRH